MMDAWEGRAVRLTKGDEHEICDEMSEGYRLVAEAQRKLLIDRDVQIERLQKTLTAVSERADKLASQALEGEDYERLGDELDNARAELAKMQAALASESMSSSKLHQHLRHVCKRLIIASEHYAARLNLEGDLMYSPETHEAFRSCGIVPSEVAATLKRGDGRASDAD